MEQLTLPDQETRQENDTDQNNDALLHLICRVCERQADLNTDAQHIAALCGKAIKIWVRGEKLDTSGRVACIVCYSFVGKPCPKCRTVLHVSK